VEDWHGAQQVGPTGPSGVPDAPPHRVEHPPGVTGGGSLVPHRPWSTVLLVVHALGVPAGVAVVVYSVVMVVAAYAPPDPEDGINEPWGLVIGPVLAAFGVGVIVAAVVLTMLTVHGRRAADQGRPGWLHGLAITAVVFAAMGAVGSFVFAVPVGLVLCGIWELTGVLVVRSTRVTSRA